MLAGCQLYCAESLPSLAFAARLTRMTVRWLMSWANAVQGINPAPERIQRLLSDSESSVPARRGPQPPFTIQQLHVEADAGPRLVRLFKPLHFC